ncbi:MAG: FAD-binding oxidoreductase [Planctomycetes bacterium]|jgi:Na+-transporting NADH:ubiquinone oxidoreductase subunit F|nr:FAD-binding oxidoreductase [Planctomycetota bacterium]
MIGSTLISVLIVSAIGAALAAVLVVSEYFIGNYGECRIVISDDREWKVQGGRNLLSILTAEKIFIPSACGGRGTCGLCKLKVLEGAGNILPTEEPYLSKEERAAKVRLCCQVKVKKDLRILIPRELLTIQEYATRCTRIINLTHDIKLFRLQLIEPATMDYVPGQYVQMRTPVYEKSSVEVYRAYSIASDPADKSIIELIIRLVPNGICTTYCFKYLREGDEVRINGPYGDFRLSDTEAPIIFIAGGSGMAPIKCILHHMKNVGSKRPAVYYFGANKTGELFYTDLMRQWESQLRSFRFVPVVASVEGRETWNGEVGLVTQAVQRSVNNGPECEAYLCGSPGMIDASIKVLEGLGVTDNRIFYDKFS